jgi:subtilisin family serine protease
MRAARMLPSVAKTRQVFHEGLTHARTRRPGFVSRILAVGVLVGRVLVGTVLICTGSAGFASDAVGGTRLAGAPDRPPAPLRGSSARSVTGEYIVVLKDSSAMRAAGLGSPDTVVSEASSRSRKLGVAIEHTYSHALLGYSAKLTAAQLARVRQDPAVAYVQPNQTYHATTTERDAPWGLDRVDQRGAKLNSRYYYTNTGKGVTAYIVDTGIRGSHLDFTRDTTGSTVPSRVTGGVDEIGDGHGTSDCAGHGTHVAGVVGGTIFGVAKEVTLVPVRVLDCNGESEEQGSSDTVLAGVDWIVANHTGGPAVANMSLANGGGTDPALEAAVQQMIADGVTTVIAAGNGDADGNGVSACGVSPGRVTAAITVGASTTADKRATFSNYGSCVDLYAPGVGIESDWNTADDEVVVADGTSMATPHVAGAVALYLQRHPTASPATVQSAIVKAATAGVVTNVSSKWPHGLLFAVQPVDTPTATTTPGAIPAGQALLKGKQVCSPNTLYCFSQRSSDGTLVLTKPGDRLLFTSGKPAAWTIMQANGNLASYDTYGHGKWSSATSGGPATLTVRDNGTAAIVNDASGEVTWTSNAAQRVPAPQPVANSAHLDHSLALYRSGVKLQSANGTFQLIFKPTGDLVLWKVKSGLIWHTGAKDADWLTVTSTGNLVLYRSDGTIAWSSRTSGAGPATLTVQDNGDCTLRRIAGNTIVWQTHTAGA